MTTAPTPPATPAKPRYALIGTGSRAGMYVGALTGAHRGDGDLVALLDVNAGRAAVHADDVEAAGLPRPALGNPDDLERVIAEHHVDRVIVTTPDRWHAEYVVRAMDAGADVVVEKPLTIDEAGSRAIAEAVARTGRSLVVTFNYRYSPRNTALRQVIADGRIGRVTGVQFEWVLDTNHGADYFRRWHRDKANSGGLLIHKASHHFDLVNWWIADVPARVYASGGLRFYGDQHVSELGLAPRPERGTGSSRTDPFSLDLRDDARLEQLYLEQESFDGYRRDSDPFDAGITIEDDVSLVVDYVSGASMSYSLTAHSPWEGYRIAITGTEGRAELEVVERGHVDARGSIDPSFRVEDHDGGERADAHVDDEDAAADPRPVSERLVVQRLWERAREIPIPSDVGDHGGGDALLLAEVFRGAANDPLGRQARLVDGVRAICVGVAGNISLRTGQAVRIADLDLGIDVVTGALGGGAAAETPLKTAQART